MTGPRTPLRPDSPYVFDASPLSAFARVGRLDLLEKRYSDRATWTIEVQDEIRRGVGRHPDLQGVLDAAWLPEPVRLTEPADLRLIEGIRWSLGGRPQDPYRHLGEAATIVAVLRRTGIAVLDDRDARRVAGARGVPLVGTPAYYARLSATPP